MQMNVLGHILGRQGQISVTPTPVLPCNICPGVSGWGSGRPIDSIDMFQREAADARRDPTFTAVLPSELGREQQNVYESQIRRETDLTWRRL